MNTETETIPYLKPFQHNSKTLPDVWKMSIASLVRGKRESVYAKMSKLAKEKFGRDCGFEGDSIQADL